MAEIQIERKESPSWLWILLLLLAIGVLAWWFLSRRGDTSEPADAATLAGAVVDTGPGAQGTTDGVADYLRFVQDNSARTDMENVHEFTADGIRRLSAALRAVVDRDAAGGAAGAGDLGERIEWLRLKADSLQRNPQSSEHAGQARDAFIGAAAMMEQLQQRHPNIGQQVSRTREAARALRENTGLLEQRAAVQQFFERAADVLRTTAGT